ncbi:MAG: coenzyme F420-0:L-glutamate ligase [Rubrivivax sp.]|nr:coenzyme F420-0:L-glutamate ligase [Rubrivivax sp.]ODU06515.1 MAG: coenzyme F420-0:L-glutamate ligase [Rubrivivax sp. SCN 71-131]
MTAARIELLAVPGLPEVRAGDDLAALVAEHARAAGIDLRTGDVVVFAQKVVSKAEGRIVELATVQPSARAHELAERVGKDARLIELILGESSAVVRAVSNVLIVRHRLGFVMANAGVDQSNVPGHEAGERALLLPVDPDASAARLRTALVALSGADVAVLINDSFGRPWRRGAVGTAIGCAGIAALQDLRGRPDRHGRTLRVTEVGTADEIAAAASLLMGQADEGLPVVIVRGLARAHAPSTAAVLVRAADEDLFA